MVRIRRLVHERFLPAAISLLSFKLFGSKFDMDAFKEAIRSGLEEYLQSLGRAIDGLTPAEARWQPTMHTNHIAWLVWHMARVEDSWVNRVLSGTTQVWKTEGWADRFGMDLEETGSGQTSEDVRAMPEIPLNELMEYFGAVRAATYRYLDHASDDDLLQEYSNRGSNRIGTWIVGHILVEESQHTGQVALIRGLMRGLGA
jgi:uncharacterized damage-inducible protein DinB